MEEARVVPSNKVCCDECDNEIEKCEQCGDYFEDQEPIFCDGDHICAKSSCVEKQERMK